MTNDVRDEIDLILNSNPEMIITCINSFIKNLRSRNYPYKCNVKIGDVPDSSNWGKTYSAYCDFLLERDTGDVKIGKIKMILIPDEKTLLKIQTPDNYDSPLGHLLKLLLGEFQRLGFVHFEKEKPPLGFKLPKGKQS